MWPTVREKVRQRSRSLEAMLLEATVRSIDGDTLVLMHSAAPLAKRLSESNNADIIREALKDALGVDWRVRCEPGTASAVGEPAGSGARDRSAQAVSAAEAAAAEAAAADEASMLAEAAEADDLAVPRRDPEEVALELLQNELGARKIES